MAVGRMPPNWVSIIHHGTYELLVQCQSVPDGNTSAPVLKRSEYPSLWDALATLIRGTKDLLSNGLIYNMFLSLKEITGKSYFSEIILLDVFEQFVCSCDIHDKARLLITDSNAHLTKAKNRESHDELQNVYPKHILCLNLYK